MAEPDEMLGRERTAELIIDTQGVFGVNPFTDDHDRTLAPRPLPRGTEERIDHHDAVDPLVEVGGPGDEVASTAGGTQCAYEQILVGRLHREKLLPWTHLNALKTKLEFKIAS